MGFVDELLGQQHAARLGHRHGRGAQMLAKLAAQLAFPHAQTLGERIHPVVVQRAQFNELQGARHAVGQFVSGADFRRRLGPAAQAGVKAGLLRGGSRREERDVLRQRRTRRAHRAAIDARRLDGREEAAVVTGIAHLDGAIAGVVVQVHQPKLLPRPGRDLAVFGHGCDDHTGVRKPPAARPARFYIRLIATSPGAGHADPHILFGTRFHPAGPDAGADGCPAAVARRRLARLRIPHAYAAAAPVRQRRRAGARRQPALRAAPRAGSVFRRRGGRHQRSTRGAGRHRLPAAAWPGASNGPPPCARSGWPTAPIRSAS
ncbi:hypothetical protein G6F35_013225 [Rhizopus arrhizus]|nr:hypothetical protein G6F35_013225 [Rhizopus arrhizus]